MVKNRTIEIISNGKKEVVCARCHCNNIFHMIHMAKGVVKKSAFLRERCPHCGAKLR